MCAAGFGTTNYNPVGLNFKDCLSGQIEHQLDATLCRFYFCRVTLHVPGASAHHQEYLKLVQRPLVRVLSLQVSHHISLLGPELNACREGIDLQMQINTFPISIQFRP